MKIPAHLAGLAILASFAATHVQASVATFDSAVSFGTAASGMTTYGFDGITVPEPGCSGCAYGPQTVGGVTFDSTGAPFVVAGQADRYGGVQFFSGQSSDLRPSDVIVTLAGTYAIGFTYGAYVTDPGTPVTITLNTGDVFTRLLPPVSGVDTNFLGFVSTTPITSITFATIDNVPAAPPYAYSMDIVSFTTAAPVPEPAEWALMACGLGAVAFLARRKKRINVV